MKHEGRKHMGEINCTFGAEEGFVADCKSKDRGSVAVVYWLSF